ncbi:hypothetical protein [Streptomyces antimycoticus]|uniref:hypothetical protein n=1 Tax=Streptomyces antimycoticus TaxID=68175 RepID=UPI0036EFF1F0
MLAARFVDDHTWQLLVERPLGGAPRPADRVPDGLAFVRAVPAVHQPAASATSPRCSTAASDTWWSTRPRLQPTVIVTGADAGDRTAAQVLLARVAAAHRRLELVRADGGCTGSLIARRLTALVLVPAIVAGRRHAGSRAVMAPDRVRKRWSGVAE